MEISNSNFFIQLLRTEHVDEEKLHVMFRRIVSKATFIKENRKARG